MPTRRITLGNFRHMLRTLSMSFLAACAFATISTQTALADNNVLDERMAKILAAQSDETKARYGARRPAETMAFCELREGDMVIETHPGGGWYSRILYPYLGKSGHLIGAQYPLSLFQRFGWDDKRLQTVLNRDKDWSGLIAADPVAEGGAIDIYAMTEMPERFEGKADKVLFIRSLHNLNRFGDETGYLKDSIAEAFRSLKPGGVACVVQHQAPDSASDAWANGSNGYLKKSYVIAAFEAAGFTLAATSDMHENPKDKPTDKESVWRLPPNFRGAEENSEQRRAYEEIGESNRMTLKFVKPTG